MRITIDPVKYKAYLHSKIVERVEANEELLNLFRRDDMSDAVGAAKAPKAFATIVDNLIACSIKATTLSKRSSGLVSLITGESKPQIEKDCEERQPSVVLAEVLRDTILNIDNNLSEISDNLEKLENAW